MSPIRKLSIEELRVPVNIPKVKDTSDIKPEYKLVGQHRALEAVEFGLSMDAFGYNIYVSGYEGIGRRSYLIEKIKERACKEDTPPDWCYVYNFEDQYKPCALQLKPGTAIEFKQDINNLIDEIIEEIPEFFSSEEYENQKSDIIEYYEKQILELADGLSQRAKEKNLIFKNTVEGFVFIPVNEENKEMTEAEYNQLSDEERENINKNVNKLKGYAYEMIRKTKVIKRELNEKLRDIESSLSTSYIDKKMDILFKKYGYNEKILDYLKNLKMDIIENIDVFIDIENIDKDYLENFLNRYEVNVLVTNQQKGAPVVFEEMPEFQKLIGIVEYENRGGNLVSDFTMIQPGSLHLANGGYLIIDVRKLLEGYWSYEALKRMLILNKVIIENLKNQFDLIPIVNIKPEPIPLKIKVILIGNPEIYHILYTYDEDFKKLFKIKADFDSEFSDNSKNVEEYIKHLKYMINKKGLLDVSFDGIAEIIVYAKKMSSSRKYISTNFTDILDVLEQADFIARDKNKDMIDRDDIEAALKNKEYRNSLIKDKILQMYMDGKYIVDVKGYKVGEINALSVVDYGDFEFGRQNKVTVNTYCGNGNIINIDREVGLGGDIFNKAILILIGYIGERFAQCGGLSFNASICFEQMYGEIDGDSATLAEIVALLSSLSDIPINQGIAITGSVNQKGEVQAVGGVNTKIKGYFEICKIFGLDGTQGVIIPSSNVDELVLDDEILEAIKENKFNIYCVDRVEDCFEVLIPSSLKKGRKNNNFELIESKILKKIEKYKGTLKEKSKKE